MSIIVEDDCVAEIDDLYFPPTAVPLCENIVDDKVRVAQSNSLYGRDGLTRCHNQPCPESFVRSHLRVFDPVVNSLALEEFDDEAGQDEVFS